MESIGEKLRTTREEKSLSIDQVARDTNIAKRYIVALEDEAFSEFPGEPYLIGFLRNYADYLGLEAEEIVSLYKNFKIQEQPVPMEELLEPKRSRRGSRVIIGIVVVAAVIVVGVLVIPPYLAKRSGGVTTATQKVQASGTEFPLSDEVVERRFVSGDTVVVPVGDKSYRVKLTVSGRTLLLTYAGGQQTLTVGQERSIDLNGDGTPDLKVFLRDIDTQDPAHGVVVRFDRFTQSPKAPVSAQQTTPAATGAAAAAAKPSTATQPAGGATSQPAATASTPASQAASAATSAPAPAAPTTAGSAPVQQSTPAAPPAPAVASRPPAPPSPAPSTASAAPASAPVASVPTITPQESAASVGPVVILQNSAASPFTVNVDFTGSCLFRYLIDGRSVDQRYFQKGETTRLEVNSDLEIWASNGGALDVSVSGNHVDMGNPGQVVVRKIAWVQNQESGDFQLQMTRMR